MPRSFFSSENKKTIRKQWNAPLLEFLKNHFNKKLAYFGLPSPKAEDINDWIDFIDYIVAFQCRDYPKPSDPSQNDAAIRELEKNLNVLWRQKKIEDFKIYDGYIEEVIINGKDNVNLKFNLNNFITLYNLDFCNEITVPQMVFNKITGKDEPIYKLHVIKKIIDMQRENNSTPYKFVILLTVKANFWKKEEAGYVSCMKDDPIYGRYFNKISHLRGSKKSVRILRTYIFQTLSNVLCTNCYIPEFLPVVLYRGTGRNDLVQFTIVCTFENTFGRSAIMRQNPNDLINQSFLTPNSNKYCLEPATLSSIKEITPSSDPTIIFKMAQVYDQFWKQ